MLFLITWHDMTWHGMACWDCHLCPTLLWCPSHGRLGVPTSRMFEILGRRDAYVTDLTVCSGYHQITHPSPTRLALLRGIRRGPQDSPHKGPVISHGWVYYANFIHFIISLIFQNHQNTGYLLNITFIFYKCYRNSTVVAPVKYSCNLKNVICTFSRAKISLMGKGTEL